MTYLEQFHHFFMGDPEKPKLIFLHGLLGFSANWRSVARQFEGTHHIFVFDQRGHGRSIQPESGYAPEDYADDLLKLMDEMNWGQASLVGHSMGGRNAMNFAARFPERVEKLVVEDIGPIGNPAAIEYYKNMFNAVPVPFLSRQAARAFMTHEFPKVWSAENATSTTLGQFLYSNLVESLDGQVSWRFSMPTMIASVLLGHARPRWSEWESLRMPTLLIRGDLSRDLPQSTYEEMLARNPHAKGVVIAEAGHWIHFEKLQPFVAVLKEFLLDIETE